MYHKTIFHTLPDGTNAKFSIFDRVIDGERYYYAMVINVELDIYKSKSPLEQEHMFGIEITDGQQHSINYKDPNKLIEDIISKYGHEWLKTEK